jgi:hypothetical protein
VIGEVVTLAHQIGHAAVAPPAKEQTS